MKTIKPGFLTPEDARVLNDALREVERLRRLEVVNGSGLTIQRGPNNIVIGLSRDTGGGPDSPYPYDYANADINSVVIPLARYRCNGNNLQERIEYWRLTAPQISATVFDYDPNADGASESQWWCVGGDCVQSATPPIGYNSGPYLTQSQCAENCI